MYISFSASLYFKTLHILGTFFPFEWKYNLFMENIIFRLFFCEKHFLTPLNSLSVRDSVLIASCCFEKLHFSYFLCYSLFDLILYYLQSLTQWYNTMIRRKSGIWMKQCIQVGYTYKMCISFFLINAILMS